MLLRLYTINMNVGNLLFPAYCYQIVFTLTLTLFDQSLHLRYCRKWAVVTSTHPSLSAPAFLAISPSYTASWPPWPKYYRSLPQRLFFTSYFIKNTTFFMSRYSNLKVCRIAEICFWIHIHGWWLLSHWLHFKVLAFFTATIYISTLPRYHYTFNVGSGVPRFTAHHQL